MRRLRRLDSLLRSMDPEWNSVLSSTCSDHGMNQKDDVVTDKRTEHAATTRICREMLRDQRQEFEEGEPNATETEQRQKCDELKTGSQQIDRDVSAKSDAQKRRVNVDLLFLNNGDPLKLSTNSTKLRHDRRSSTLTNLSELDSSTAGFLNRRPRRGQITSPKRVRFAADCNEAPWRHGSLPILPGSSDYCRESVNK